MNRLQNWRRSRSFHVQSYDGDFEEEWTEVESWSTWFKRVILGRRQ